MTRTFEVDYPGRPRLTVTVRSTDQDWRPAVFRALHQHDLDPQQVTACCQAKQRKETR